MVNEKKCPHCEKWSVWNTNVNDTCQHCGKVLAPLEQQQQILKENRIVKQEKEWLFYFDQNAPFYEKFVKKVGNYIYYVIMAIVSFIMYLLFWSGP